MKKDLYRYTGEINYIVFLKKILGHSGARNIFFLRMCQRYNKWNPIGLCFRVFYNLNLNLNCCEIPHSTNIGPGFYCGHFKNIIINQNAIVGENCNINQGVTIGNQSRGKKKGAPIVGSRVKIGPNSVISGKIKIGDDVLIGPLTFVNFIELPSLLLKL